MAADYNTPARIHDSGPSRRRAVRQILTVLACLVLANSLPAADKLTPQEVADGWIMLFDGETTFGWKIDGEAAVRDGVLMIGGEKPTTASTTGAFMTFQFVLETTNGTGGEQMPRLRMVTSDPSPLSGSREARGTYNGAVKPRSGPIVIEVPAGGKVELRRLNIRPTGMKSHFNGKDLDGWKQFTANPKQAKSKFSVT